MNTPNPCRDRREDIAALILGEADSTTAEQVGQHIDTCDRCRAFRDALANQERMLRSTFDVIACSTERVRHLAESLAEPKRQPESTTTSPLGMLIGGIRTMRRSHKILAAAAAIALTFTGLTSWLVPGRSNSGIAIADVLQQIREFRPYSYLSTAQDKGGSAASTRITYLTPSRRRQAYPDGRIIIFDMSRSPIRSLTLVPNQKAAVEEALLNVGPHSDLDMLHLVSDWAAQCTTTDLGSRELEGRPAHGFHLLNQFNDITYWADAKTGLPIRVEIVHVETGRRITMTEFDFSPKLHESQFSTTAPAGYTVQRVEKDGVNPTEEHLIEGLRAIATFLDGRFPAALDARTIRKALQDRFKQTGASPSEEQMKDLQLKTDRAVRYGDLLRHYYKVSGLTYAGDGVKLGDARAAVMWWKPATSADYRVIYGDLSVKDVKPENVPKPRKTSTSPLSPDAMKQLRVFRPYSCLCTWEYKGKPPYSYREMHLSRFRRRETRPHGQILVFDLSREPNTILTLAPEQKTAVEQSIPNTGPRQGPDYFGMVADAQDGSAEDLGLKEVDGRLAHGFHKPDDVNDFTVWADPKTGLPIRIEMVQPTASRRFILSEFDFNARLDESLFSTTAPTGYSVKRK